MLALKVLDPSVDCEKQAAAKQTCDQPNEAAQQGARKTVVHQEVTCASPQPQANQDGLPLIEVIL
jgi:hypothetical protein